MNNSKSVLKISTDEELISSSINTNSTESEEKANFFSAIESTRRIATERIENRESSTFDIDSIDTDSIDNISDAMSEFNDTVKDTENVLRELIEGPLGEFS